MAMFEQLAPRATADGNSPADPWLASLPPGRFAFLDLETTGTDPTQDRITEIGVLTVDDGVAQENWSQLIDPGMPIPPAIQALTGITPAMVRDAPAFTSIAERAADLLKGRILVAHNARFDYGFLKAAYRRLGIRFQAEVLCTVRLSRQLYPDATGHGLDALIARHRLGDEARHRALGDARLIARFVAQAADELGQAVMSGAIDDLLKRSARPIHRKCPVRTALNGAREEPTMASTNSMVDTNDGAVSKGRWRADRGPVGTALVHAGLPGRSGRAVWAARSVGGSNRT